MMRRRHALVGKGGRVLSVRIPSFVLPFAIAAGALTTAGACAYYITHPPKSVGEQAIDILKREYSPDTIRRAEHIEREYGWGGVSGLRQAIDCVEIQNRNESFIMERSGYYRPFSCMPGGGQTVSTPGQSLMV